MANDAKVEIVISAKDQASAAIKELSTSLKSLTGELSTGGAAGQQAMEGISSSAGLAATGIGTIAAVVATATAAVAGLGVAFKAAIAGIEKFEQTAINIASQLTNMAAEGQGSFKEMFEKNQEFAKAFYDKLRGYDAERASSIEEMMTTYNSLVTQGYQVRMDEAKALSLVTDLIKQKTAGQGFEIQVMQEVRALLDGQANANSRIAMELKSKMGPAWKDIMESHKQAGTLLQWVADMYPGIEASSGAMQKTLEAQNTTLKSQLTYIGREGLQGAYDDIVGLMQQINTFLKEHAEDIIPALQRGWTAVSDLIKGVYGFIKDISNIVSTVTKWVINIAFTAGAGDKKILAFLTGGGELPFAFGGEGLPTQAEADKRWSEELTGYETGMKEQMAQLRKPGYKDLYPIGQTTGAVKDNFANAVKEGTVKGYQEAAEIIAREKGLDPVIFKKLIGEESSWDRYAKSPKGAMGLGQLMPGTAAGLGVKDAYDAGQNLRGAATYLKQQLDKFGRYDFALAAYNAGPGAVEKYGGVPPYKETQKYVWDIMGTGGSRANAGIKEKWKNEESAAKKAASEQERLLKQQERDRDAYNKRQLANTFSYLKEDVAAAERTGREIEKIELDTIKYKKKIEEEYKDWYSSALREIMQDEKLSYKERANAAEAYRADAVARIDEEARLLHEKFPGRIDETTMGKYKTSQLHEIDRQIASATNPQVVNWEAAWKRASENIQDAMADMIMNLFDQSKSASDMLQSLLKGMMNILAQTAAQSLMGAAQNFMGGLFSGKGGGGGSGGGIGGFFSGIGSLFGMGGGGAAAASSWTTGGAAIATDMASWGSYATFADGGVSASPQLAWVSETGPEAHVPLKGGSIPVQLSGGQSGGNYISVSHNPVYNYRPDKADYERDAKMIVQALDKELRGFTKRTARNFVRI